MPEFEVEVEEEEDLKLEENVLNEEDDQMYQMNLEGGRGPIFTEDQEREIIIPIKPTLSVIMPFSIMSIRSLSQHWHAS